MSKRQIVLSDAVAQVVETQVASGRYADFSAAVQDATWHFFVGPPTPFEEYGVTPAEIERSALKDLERIRRGRKTGSLKTWQPRSIGCPRLNAPLPGCRRLNKRQFRLR